MPRISKFHGIAIYLYYLDHVPPHFHAISGEDEAASDVASGQVIAGGLLRRSMQYVKEWWTLHQGELMANRGHANASQPLSPIPPLS